MKLPLKHEIGMKNDRHLKNDKHSVWDLEEWLEWCWVRHDGKQMMMGLSAWNVNVCECEIEGQSAHIFFGGVSASSLAGLIHSISLLSTLMIPFRNAQQLESLIICSFKFRFEMKYQFNIRRKNQMKRIVWNQNLARTKISNIMEKKQSWIENEIICIKRKPSEIDNETHTKSEFPRWIHFINHCNCAFLGRSRHNEKNKTLPDNWFATVSTSLLIWNCLETYCSFRYGEFTLIHYIATQWMRIRENAHKDRFLCANQLFAVHRSNAKNTCQWETLLNLRPIRNKEKNEKQIEDQCTEKTKYWLLWWKQKQQKIGKQQICNETHHSNIAIRNKSIILPLPRATKRNKTKNDIVREPKEGIIFFGMHGHLHAALCPITHDKWLTLNKIELTTRFH